MADMSGGILVTSSKTEEGKLRMGSFITSSIEEPSSRFYGRVGPFVRVKETGQLCFLMAKCILSLNTVGTAYIGVKIYDTSDHILSYVCGTVIGVESNNEDKTGTALVSTNPKYVSKDIGQIYRSRFDFHGVSALPFQEINKGETSRMMKLVMFAEEVRMSEGRISPCAPYHFDKQRGLIFPNTENFENTESYYEMEILSPKDDFFNFGDAGAAVFTIDEQSVLHCIGLLIGKSHNNPNLFVLVNINTCLRHFKEQHGYTIEMIEWNFEREESKTQTEKDTKLWDLSVQLHDSSEIENLLEDGYLPNKEQLKTACMVFSRSSEIIDIITCKICTKIYLTNPSKILRVWAGYRSGEESDIVLVVVTKEENADIDFAFDYDLVIRGKEEFSLENRSVIYQENVQDLFPTKEVMLDVQRCINKYVESLTNDHSNLRIIAGSSFKSKRYMKPGRDMIKRTCIVFYVHIKGVIPIKEKEFPKTLTSENSIIYETDVREGYVDLKAGGWPDEIHTDVKMGCKIGGMENEDEFGTLGGFLELPRYGLCCLTCAHILVDEAKGEYEDDEFICYQPNLGNEKTYGQRRRFGCLRIAKTYAGDTQSSPPKAGLDYALIKLDEDRKPVDGSFPDTKITEWKTAGFDVPMTYTSGEVFDFDQMYVRRRNPIIKYGARTGVTCGSLAWYGQCIVQDGLPKLLNQIQVNHTITNEKIQVFSKNGDSGSLVFMVDNQNIPTAIGMLTCGSATLGCSYITPIKEILDDTDIEKMKTFVQE